MKKQMQALRRAVKEDPTLPLKLAAEACVSHRSVLRCLDDYGVRQNTQIAILRAWDRLRGAPGPSGPRVSRLEDASAAPPKESQLVDTRPPSRLKDAPKRRRSKPSKVKARPRLAAR